MKIPFECKCGALSGTAETKNAYGYRAICLCVDCQAYAHYLKRADILDANGGTDVIPFTPASLEITSGYENLRSLRLSPNGMYRWYAGCCNTPLGNTQAARFLPFVGVPRVVLEKKNSAESLEKYFGPVRAYLMGKQGLGTLPPGASKTVSPGFLLRVLKFSILGIWRSERQPSPFFDANEKPKVEAYVLTKAERDALQNLKFRG
jgi:hypothetical protein